MFHTPAYVTACALCEMFCDEKGCDCRRVMFYIVSSLWQSVVAVVAYGWENRQSYIDWLGENDPLMIDDLIGPSLNIGSPQSKEAPAILELIREALLSDPAYVEHVKRHYTMFRRAIDGGSSPPATRKFKKRRRKR